ncbi:MAG: methyltransferase domain-containing protein [Betaproteobacteria bacterium]|nr:methyltransferase domain-containing protein [Betaproteobacteria bacterium]
MSIQEVKGAAYWDDRFQAPSYAYGEAPNDFLQWAAPQVKPGQAVSLCEGEGRNAVFLAQMGFKVTAVDFSRVGLKKAQALAEQHKVRLNCVLADLKDLWCLFNLGESVEMFSSRLRDLLCLEFFGDSEMRLASKL